MGHCFFFYYPFNHVFSLTLIQRDSHHPWLDRSRTSDLVRSRDGVPLPRAWKGGAVPDAPSPEPTAVRERLLLPADAAGGAPALPPRGEQSRAGCGSPGPAPRGWQPSRCGCAAAWTRRAGMRTGRPARWEPCGTAPTPPAWMHRERRPGCGYIF